MRSDEFYIGWMQEAPAFFMRFLKRYVLALLFVVAAISILLAAAQRKFSTANFEYGKRTTLSGTFSSMPVPHLIVKKNSEILFVPLVGYGKQGADGIMIALGEEKGGSLEGKELTMAGTLLYGDGKLLMQVDRSEEPLVKFSDGANAIGEEQDLGTAKFKGEVIDPKCYFGVMKPGEGKVHKDCAIRCISGGIPPVLAITNDKGEKNYILLVGPNGEKLNEKVRDYVAVPSTVSGQLYRYQDWLVMKVREMNNEFATFDGTKIISSECSSSCCKKR